MKVSAIAAAALCLVGCILPVAMAMLSGCLMFYTGSEEGPFSVLGILLSIPTAAVLSFLYHDYLLPWLKKRKQRAVAADTAGGDKE